MGKTKPGPFRSWQPKQTILLPPSPSDWLNDQAHSSIEAVPAIRDAADQPSLRERLSRLKASIESETSLDDTTGADALSEVNELALAAQDPVGHARLYLPSINAFEGLTTGSAAPTKMAPGTSQLVQAVKKVLPPVAVSCLSPIRPINTHGHPGGTSQRLPNLSPSAEF